jgi:hypothetical protein
MSELYEDDEQQQQEQPAPAARTTGQSATHGRVARMRDGTFAMWQEAPNGRGGRFVALNTSTADPRSREQYEEVQNRARVGRDTLRFGEDFIDENREQRSGGMLDRWQLATGMQAADFAVPFSDSESLPRLQRMRNLSRQIVGANWIPGTGGMQNTAVEQENVAQRYMTPGTRGPVNLEIYLDMAEGVAEQEAAVQDMQRWLTRHTTLDGWHEQFRPQARQVRQRARNEALRRYHAGPFNGQAAPQQQGATAPPPQQQRASQRNAPAPQPQQRASQPVRVTTQAQYAALPSGTPYVDSAGNRGVKP